MTKSYIYLIDFITEHWGGEIIIDPINEQKYNIEYLEEKTNKNMQTILSEFKRGKRDIDIDFYFFDTCIKNRKFILRLFLIELAEQYGII